MYCKYITGRKQKMYYQGKDCKYNHGGIRYNSTSQCVQCEKMRAKRNRRKRTHIEKFYYGKDCRYNHGGIRYSSTGQCIQCAKIRNKTLGVYKIWLFKKSNGTDEELIRFAEDGLLDDWINWSRCDGVVDYYIKYIGR